MILSNYYDLPFNDILDWHKFAVILKEHDVYQLKQILKDIPDAEFVALHKNLVKVLPFYLKSKILSGLSDLYYFSIFIWSICFYAVYIVCVYVCICALSASSSVGEQLTIVLSLISMVFSVYPKKKGK